MAYKHQKGSKKLKTPNRDSFVESMRDIGQGGFDSFKNDLVRQFLGLERAPMSASGELKVGEPLIINKVLEEEKEENKVLRAQVARERSLRQESEAYNSRQTQELKLQLKALTTKAENIVKETIFLSQEVKIAIIQAPVEPGIYHITFFQNLLSFMESFRKKIHEANLWLASAKKRSRK